MVTTTEKRQAFSADLIETVDLIPSLENETRVEKIVRVRLEQRRTRRKRRNYRRMQANTVGRRPIPVDPSWTVARLKDEAVARKLDLAGSSKWKKSDWLAVLN